MKINYSLVSSVVSVPRSDHPELAENRATESSSLCDDSRKINLSDFLVPISSPSSSPVLDSPTSNRTEYGPNEAQHDVFWFASKRDCDIQDLSALPDHLLGPLPEATEAISATAKQYSVDQARIIVSSQSSPILDGSSSRISNFLVPYFLRFCIFFL